MDRVIKKCNPTTRQVSLNRIFRYDNDISGAEKNTASVLSPAKWIAPKVITAKGKGRNNNPAQAITGATVLTTNLARER